MQLESFETLMLGGILFQRIDPRALNDLFPNDLFPINLLVLGTARIVSFNAEHRPFLGGKWIFW